MTVHGLTVCQPCVGLFDEDCRQVWLVDGVIDADCGMLQQCVCDRATQRGTIHLVLRSLHASLVVTYMPARGITPKVSCLQTVLSPSLVSVYDV